MSKKRVAFDGNRITVTLADGQREILERIAKQNETTLAYVIRYAIKQLIRTSEDGQLRLEFPKDE